MKLSKLTFLIFAILTFNNCSDIQQNKVKNNLDAQERNPLTSIKEAQEYVKLKFTKKDETLWISNTLNDPEGINMAIILDGILKAGYMPDEFEQKDGYRIYKYKWSGPLK